jgi:hypothetical protein
MQRPIRLAATLALALLAALVAVNTVSAEPGVSPAQSTGSSSAPRA